jgi:predicted metal-dependent hydrolase
MQLIVPPHYNLYSAFLKQLLFMPRATSPAFRTETITYQNQPLSYQLCFRPRRTLGFIVRPDGRVQVNAPRGTAPDWVAAQVLKKADWILKHQTAFRQRPAAPSSRPPEAGMVCYFLGQPHTLRLLEGPKPLIELVGNELHVFSPAPLLPGQLKALLDEWYGRQAAAHFGQALEQIWPKFAEFNLPRPSLSVRYMRTRWGSCTPRTGRIRLSRDLVRAHPECIAYVVLHECCHLLVPNHSQAFYDLQTQLLPDWRRWKSELNALPK